MFDSTYRLLDQHSEDLRGPEPGTPPSERTRAAPARREGEELIDEHLTAPGREPAVLGGVARSGGGVTTEALPSAAGRAVRADRGELVADAGLREGSDPVRLLYAAKASRDGVLDLAAPRAGVDVAREGGYPQPCAQGSPDSRRAWGEQVSAELGISLERGRRIASTISASWSADALGASAGGGRLSCA